MLQDVSWDNEKIQTDVVKAPAAPQIFLNPPFPLCHFHLQTKKDVPDWYQKLKQKPK